jgi:glycosyltransferase involved in cell wall biosynthesis
MGETVTLPHSLYLSGETLLRIPGLFMSKARGHYEYSRYDYVMELAAIKHFKKHHDSIYHFVYGEKSFRMLARHAGTNGNKIVLSVHHPPEHSKWLFKSMDHFKSVDHITVVSRNMIEFWEGIIGKGNVSYIPYAVDTNYFRPSAENREDDKKICIFIGHHERDFKTLSSLVPRILEMNPNAEFHMISSNKACATIQHDNNRSFWHQRLDDESYRKMLSRAHLLVLPLRASTTLTAVLEAMSSGVPIITNEGGIEDYLDSSFASVLPVEDVNGMAESTKSILQNEDKHAIMAEAARQKALSFSWSSTAEKMVEIYKQIMK